VKAGSGSVHERFLEKKAARDRLPNSVLLSSGQMWSQQLLSISALGVGGWGFRVDYMPGNAIDGVLGKNFNFTQNQYLIELGGGDVQLVTGQNTQETFV